MELATLDDLQARVDVTDEARALEALVDATAAIEAVVGQVNQATSTVNIRPVAGRLLWLPLLPATAPTGVTINSVAVTDYTFDVDRLYRPSGWSQPDVNGYPYPVAVTYTHGWATVPDEVIRVCCQIAQRILGTPDSNLRSETVGDYSYTLAGPPSLASDEVQAVRNALGLAPSIA